MPDFRNDIPTGTKTDAYTANSVANVYMSFKRNDLHFDSETGRSGFLKVSADPLDLRNHLVSFEVDFGYANNKKQYAMRLINPTEEFEVAMFRYLDRVYPTTQGIITSFEKEVAAEKKDAGFPQPAAHASPTLPYLYVRWGYGNSPAEGLSQIHKVVLVNADLQINANKDKMLDLTFADLFSFVKGSSTFNLRSHTATVAAFNPSDPSKSNSAPTGPAPKSGVIHRNTGDLKKPSEILDELITKYAAVYPQCIPFTNLSLYADRIDAAVYNVAKAMAEGDTLTRVNALVKGTTDTVGAYGQKAGQRQFQTAQLTTEQVAALELHLVGKVSSQSPGYVQFTPHGVITRDVLLKAYALVFKELGLSYDDGQANDADWLDGPLSFWQNKLSQPTGFDPAARGGLVHQARQPADVNALLQGEETDRWNDDLLSIPVDLITANRDKPWYPENTNPFRTYDGLPFKPMMLKTETPAAPYLPDVEMSVHHIHTVEHPSIPTDPSTGDPNWVIAITVAMADGDKTGTIPADKPFEMNGVDGEATVIEQFNSNSAAHDFYRGDVIFSYPPSDPTFYLMRQDSSTGDLVHWPWPRNIYGSLEHTGDTGEIVYHPEQPAAPAREKRVVVPISDEEYENAVGGNWAPIWLYPGCINQDDNKFGSSSAQRPEDRAQQPPWYRCSISDIERQLQTGWTGNTDKPEDLGKNFFWVEIPNPGPHRINGGAPIKPQPPIRGLPGPPNQANTTTTVTEVGGMQSGFPPRLLYPVEETSDDAGINARANELRNEFQPQGQMFTPFTYSTSTSYFPIWDPATQTLLPFSDVDQFSGGEYQQWRAYAAGNTQTPFHNRFTYLEPTKETRDFFRRAANTYGDLFQKKAQEDRQKANTAIVKMPANTQFPGVAHPPNIPVRVIPSIPADIMITMGTEGESPHISNVLEKVVQGLNKIIVGEPSKLLFIAVDLGNASPAQLKTLRAQVLKDVPAETWREWQTGVRGGHTGSDFPVLLVITDTASLSDQWGKTMLNRVSSFPAITTTKNDYTIFLKYGTDDSIIGDLKFNTGPRYLFNMLQANYAVRQSNDLEALLDKSKSQTSVQNIIYAVIHNATGDLQDDKDVAYGENTQKELKRIAADTQYRGVSTQRNQTLEQLEEIREDILELFPAYMRSYTEGGLSGILSPVDERKARILASVIQDPLLINLAFPYANIDGRDNTMSTEAYVWRKHNPGRGGAAGIHVVPTTSRVLMRRVAFDESLLRTSLEKLKFLDVRATFANAMRVQAWNVEVTTLGIPELDNPMVEFGQRRVVLQVYDPRTNSVMHWLSGVYLIRRIKHRLDPKLGYLTSLKLWKDPSIDASPQSFWVNEGTMDLT